MPLNNLITNTEKVKSVPETVESSKKDETDLDEALTIAGVGIYNFIYGIVLAMFLIASIIEVIGYSYVLPAAKCDLGMTDAQRGLVASLPYIAIVVTSFPWGYLVDTRGRKRMLVISSLVCGIFTLLAAFMPNLASFIVCKCLANLFLACPSAAPYAFISEILPQKHRDIALTLTNALQMFGAALVPLLAWAIVPLDFSIDFGIYYFRSWRLLSLVYSFFFIIAGSLMIFGPESPKYLLSQGRNDEALSVLRTMYAKNTGKSFDEYPVHRLKMEQAVARPSGFLASLKSQTLPVLQPPYLKWLLLNGFLLFGIFSTLNGLFMWVPDVLNRVLIGGGVNGQTACQVISMRPNHTTTDGVCDDTIDITTFSISSIANVICASITLALSSTVKIIGKRKLLLLLYMVLGSFCVSINFITQDLVFAALLLSLQIIAFGIGPVNAYAVQIFPTHLRGMAVSLALMLGRTGSVVGTNVAGVLINRSCETTFYAFGGLLLLCGVLTFLLPSGKRTVTITTDDT